MTDAALTAGLVASLAHPSLAAPHRRGWGSRSAALTDGRSASTARRSWLARQPLADGAPVSAIATSVWPRGAAATSPERGVSAPPARPSAGQPLGAGWSDQWLAQLSVRRARWTAPRAVRRVQPRAPVQAVAAEPLHALVATQAADAPPPTCVCDAADAPDHLAREVGAVSVAVLVRLRRDRCFDAAPVDQPVPGRPRRPGAQVVWKDPAPGPAPDTDLTVEDAQSGRGRVRAGGGWHATSQHPQGGGAVGPGCWSVARSAAWQSSAGHPRPALPSTSGGGGADPERPTGTGSGAPRCAAATGHIPAASAHRCSPGPRRGSAPPTRPIAGPGWSSRPLPNSVSPGGFLLTAGCLGNGPCPPTASRLVVGGRPWPHSGRPSVAPPARHTPAAARPGAPRAASRDPLAATRPSNRSPDPAFNPILPFPGGLLRIPGASAC